jgi:hypothetical protein
MEMAYSDLYRTITTIKFSGPGHRQDGTSVMCLFAVVLHLFRVVIVWTIMITDYCTISLRIPLYCVSVLSCYCQLTNIALHKDAFQSSIGANGYASRAVDGSLQTDILQGSCSHTDATPEDNKPWWYVDLGSTYTIWAVALTNRDIIG